jgi:hypothetical protein
MNINLCDRNVDALNFSFRYRLFDCSYLKADTKYSRVFVDSRDIKLLAVSSYLSVKFSLFFGFFFPSTAWFTV